MGNAGALPIFRRPTIEIEDLIVSPWLNLSSVGALPIFQRSEVELADLIVSPWLIMSSVGNAGTLPIFRRSK